MFLVEILAGIIAGSVSLRADALDFLADAANYAIALAVVDLARHWRARAALLKGRRHGPVRSMGRRQHNLPCDRRDGAAR